MAIRNNYKKNIYGQTLHFDEAYHKITSLNGDKNFINIQITIYSDSSKEYALDQKGYNFIPDLLDTKNFIEQGYEYLKTLDEYVGYVDLLDEGQSPTS